MLLGTDYVICIVVRRVVMDLTEFARAAEVSSVDQLIYSPLWLDHELAKATVLRSSAEGYLQL